MSAGQTVKISEPSDDAAESDPESSIAIFAEQPNARVIEDFRRHVRETGKPDEWRFHAKSHPAPNEPIEIVLFPFEVPESLRSAVPKATCPICSPDHPKYYDGALAWFPRERKIRAIGIDCAKSHFGETEIAAASNRYQRRREEEAAFDDISKWLDQVPAWFRQNEELRALARDADAFKLKLLGNGTKKAWTHLLRSGKDGALVILESRRVTKRRPDGSEFDADEAFEVWRRPIDGLGFLRDGPSIESDSLAVTRLLESVPLDDHDKILSRLVETQNVLGRAREGLAGVRGRLRAAVEFGMRRNLEVISYWCDDHRSSSNLRVEIGNFRSEVWVGHRHSKMGVVLIPSGLLSPPSFIRPQSWG